jgi:hypothetical protein
MDEQRTGPRLRDLRWLGPDTCLAGFERDDGTRVETVMRLDRADGITLVQDDPSILSEIEGSAAHVRTVAAAAFTFCCAAQGESAE